MVRELWDYRELIYRLVVRNVAGQFRQSFLGYLWIILPPIATTVVFSLLQEAKIVNINLPADGMPYAIFALLGATIWGYFTQVTTMATNSISGAGPLVSKIYFPREVIVLSAVGNAVINLCIRLLVVMLTFVLLRYTPHVEAIGFFVLLIPLTALGIGLGLMLAPLNTMMHDIARLLEFAFQFGLFLAPAVYPTPAMGGGGLTDALYWLHKCNPVSHYLYALHGLVETGRLVCTTGLTISVTLSFLALLIGWRFFHVTEPMLAERM
ncbi:MAG TPA: ABC transporter permease [Kiritimatiellia bacterium]|nr:ABC transporter permease [Kiritimatiellia bacterium]